MSKTKKDENIADVVAPEVVAPIVESTEPASDPVVAPEVVAPAVTPKQAKAPSPESRLALVEAQLAALCKLHQVSFKPDAGRLIAVR